MNKIDSFLRDPQNRIVLRELLMSDLPITQRIISSCVNEIQINDAIQRSYNIKTNDILSKDPHILDSLVKMDIVIKENIGQTLSCPNCDSVDIFANYSCNKCYGASFRRKNMCIHISCNQVIIKKKYNNSGEIFCLSIVRSILKMILATVTLFWVLSAQIVTIHSSPQQFRIVVIIVILKNSV